MTERKTTDISTFFKTYINNTEISTKQSDSSKSKMYQKTKDNRRRTERYTVDIYKRQSGTGKNIGEEYKEENC